MASIHFKDIIELVIIHIAEPIVVRGKKTATSVQAIDNLRLSNADKWFEGLVVAQKFLSTMQRLLFVDMEISLHVKDLHVRALCVSAAHDTRDIPIKQENAFCTMLWKVQELGQGEPSHNAFNRMEKLIAICPRLLIGETNYKEFLRTVRERVKQWEYSSCEAHSNFGDRYTSLRETAERLSCI